LIDEKENEVWRNE